MLRDDAILMMLHCLDDFLECVRVCVTLSGLKKQKSDPAFTAKLWMKAL